MHVRRIAVLAVCALCALAMPAAAQSIAVFGAAEAAEDDVTLLLLGAGWNPGRLGWQPFASVIAYNLRFPVGATDVSRNVIAPQIGARYQTATAAMQLGVGYSMSDDDSPVVGGLTVESGEGPFGSFQWNHWGSGNRALELIASYGFDTKFAWSRFTGLQRLGDQSPLFVGGEAGLYGNTGANDFWTTQLGPAIEWRFNPAFRVGAAGGLKVGLSPATNNGTHAYGRVSFLLLPGAR